MKQYEGFNSTSSKSVPLCNKCLSKVGSLLSVPCNMPGFLLSLQLVGGERCFPYMSILTQKRDKNWVLKKSPILKQCIFNPVDGFRYLDTGCCLFSKSQNLGSAVLRGRRRQKNEGRKKGREAEVRESRPKASLHHFHAASLWASHSTAMSMSGHNESPYCIRLL